MDGLCPSLYAVFYVGVAVERLFYGGYEVCHIVLARSGCLFELAAELGVYFGFCVFYHKVLEFRLQLVESQLMGERSVELRCFAGYLSACLVVVAAGNVAHEHQTLGNHYEDDAHVIGEREQQVAEVLALDSGALCVQGIYLCKTREYIGDVAAESFRDLLHGYCSCKDATVEQYADGNFATIANLLSYKVDCVKVE